MTDQELIEHWMLKYARESARATTFLMFLARLVREDPEQFQSRVQKVIQLADEKASYASLKDFTTAEVQ